MAGDDFAPVRVLVTDDQGAPVAGARVQYSPPNWVDVRVDSCPIDNAGGCFVRSDAQGLATLPMIHAVLLSKSSLFLSSVYGQAIIELTVASDLAPATLEIFGGDHQAAAMGQAFDEPLAVRLTRGGVPEVGAKVQFTRPALFEFANPDATYVTDENGVARSSSPRAKTLKGGETIYAVASDARGGRNYSVPFFERVTAYPIAKAQSMWWAGASQSGWGMSIAQHGERIFPVLFAYNDAGKPTWWFAGGSELFEAATFTDGNVYSSALRSPVGAPYFAYSPALFRVGEATGSLALSFDRTSNAFMTYRGTGAAAAGDVKQGLQPFAFSPDVPQANRGVGDIWWGGEGQDGWGLSILEDRGNLFVTWFTYDAEGSPTWFDMSGGAWSGDNTWSGAIYRTRSDGWAKGFHTNSVSAQAAGTFSLTFSPAGNAMFEWHLDGHSGIVPIERFAF